MTQTFDETAKSPGLEFWSLYFEICLGFEYCHLGFFRFHPGKARARKAAQNLKMK